MPRLNLDLGHHHRLVALLFAVPLVGCKAEGAPSAPAACPHSYKDLAPGGGGAEQSCSCSADAAKGSVWGADVYTQDSSLCAAATHAGAIGASGGAITVKAAEGCASYQGSSRNGVTSGSWGHYPGSFYFVGHGNGSCGDAAAAPTPADPAKAWKSCPDWGLAGDGTFFEPCKGKAGAVVASPFTMTWTGGYRDDGFGTKAAAFTLESRFEREANWGNLGIWYYDKDGQLLETTAQDGNPYKYYWASGGTISIKPGEKKEIASGWSEPYTPKGTATIEAEVTHWGNNTEGQEIFIEAYSDGRDFATRPLGGWK